MGKQSQVSNQVKKAGRIVVSVAVLGLATAFFYLYSIGRKK